MIECSFDRPWSRDKTPLWFLLFWLLWSDHTPRVASNHSVLLSSHISYVPRCENVLLSLPLGS
jgi:hypothetical protein